MEDNKQKKAGDNNSKKQAGDSKAAKKQARKAKAGV